jgi:hypothetical protein
LEEVVPTNPVVPCRQVVADLIPDSGALPVAGGTALAELTGTRALVRRFGR